MPLTQDQIVEWARKDYRKRVVLIEQDYMYQSGSGAGATPTLGTLRFGNFAYTDEATSPKNQYLACLDSAADYERSLDRETLKGEGKVRVGTTVINNVNGEFDYIEALALDGSEHRCYVGDPDWAFADFLHLYTALAVRAQASPEKQLSIELRAPSLLLNKRIGGTVIVGGTGPSSNKYRPLPFGFVHQMEPIPVSSTIFAYDEDSTHCTVYAVRTNGVAKIAGVDYTDNANGTFTFAVAPLASEKVTCDVLRHAVASVTAYRVSDAFDFFIGDRAGLTSLGKYTGAGPMYELNGFNDYHMGKALVDKTNCKDICDDLCNTSNGFWAFDRLGSFFYDWMRQEALSAFVASGIPISAEFTKEDIKNGTFKVEHRLPTYASYQAVGNVNWSQQTEFSSSLNSLQREQFTRDGYRTAAFFGEEPTSTAYRGASVSWRGGAPALYHLSLSDSQEVKTLIAGPDDTTVIDVTASPPQSVENYLQDWASIHRGQSLPWTQFADWTTYLDKYFVELGNITNVTYDRHDFDSGQLTQVYKIVIKPMEASIDIGVTRRRFANVDPGVPGSPTYTVPPGDTGFFIDNFTGTGNLSTHNPDLGGAYSSDGGALTDMTLDGAGKLNYDNTGGGAFARSAAVPVVPYFLETAFTVSAADAVTEQIWLDVFVIDTVSGNWLAETFLRWHSAPGQNWEFVGLVVDSLGNLLFGPAIDVTALMTLGVEHKLRLTVTASGTIFELDGVLLSATSQKPDILPTSVEFEANIPSGAGASRFKVNYIAGVSLATPPAVPFFFFDSFDGALGLLTGHTSDSGHTWAYSAKIIFAGYSPKSGDAKINGSGIVGIDTAGGYAGLYSNFAPSTADYSVEARVLGTYAHSQRCGFAARYDEATGDGYFLSTFPVDATHVAVIVEVSYASGGGSATLIGRGGDHVVADPTSYVAKLEVSGSAIRAYLDGTLVGSATDANVTAANGIGLWLAPSGSGTYDQIAFEYLKAQPL